MGINAIGLFCEDIREEKSGQETMIGLLPDNISIAHFPGFGPKLGISIRINIDGDEALPKEIEGVVKLPWQEEPIFVGRADSELIRSSSKLVKGKLPFFGIVMRVIITPFQMPSPGQLVAYVKIDGVERVCGVLNLVSAETTSPNEPLPQAGTTPLSA